MRKFKQVIAIVLAVLMLSSIAMIGTSAIEGEHTYGIFGSQALCGTNWNPNDENNLMTANEDGTYSITYKDVAVADNYEFKVVADGNDQTSFGDNGQNFKFNVTSVCDVTITFDPATEKITVTGDGVSFTDPASWAPKFLSLRGDISPCGWEVAESNTMTEVSTRVYEITVKNVAARTYSYKYSADGAWADNWGAGEDSTALEGSVAYNGGNLSITVGELSDVTFTLDLTAFDYATKLGATHKVTVTPVGGSDVTEATQESQDTQATQESQDTQATQESQDTQETQESQDTQETQESQDTQDTQESQDTQETQESQATQESQDTQESQATQESQDTQDTQDTTPSDTRTIMFRNTVQWTEVYAYTFSTGKGDVGPAWPGTKMTYKEGNAPGDELYTVEVDKSAEFIIFHDNNGTQTGNLKLYEGIEGFYIEGGEEKYWPEDIVIPTETTEPDTSEAPDPAGAAGFYLVGSPEVCGAKWGWDSPATNGTPKLTQSTDGFYYAIIKNVKSSANSVDDKGQPRYEFKVVYLDAAGNITWHPGGMGNNTYVEVTEDGSTIVFKYELKKSNPTIEGTTQVEFTVYGPNDLANVPAIEGVTPIEAPVITPDPSESTGATDPSESTGSTDSSESTGSTDSSESTGATDSSESTGATDPSESTGSTQPVAKTTVRARAARSTIYVNSTTTVKTAVKNPVGKTTYTSSNTKVATVTSKGVVKGKKAGTVTITVKNNGVKATVRIKVIKKTNPMTVKANTLSAKAKKTTKFSKSKAFTVKKAQGRVVFKKASGNKKITVSSTGKVTVKKGLKKGTYKVKVKVTAKGNTVYNAKTKTVTLKVKVK